MGLVNNRDNWLKDPSVEEQFDILLKHFTQNSVKDNTVLWEAFKNLKRAINTFVHNGVAEVGNKVLLPSDANALISKATEIIAWVREKIPSEIRWPIFQPNVKTETYVSILEGTEEKASMPADTDPLLTNSQ